MEESSVSNLTAGDGYGVDLKLTDLRGILQYVPQFREKTFVIAVDASIVRDESFANILLEIALLRSLNTRFSKGFRQTTSEPRTQMPSLRIRWGSYRVSTTFLPGRSNASIRNFFKLF